MHPNGLGNGSNPTTGSDSTGDQSGAGEQAGKVKRVTTDPTTLRQIAEKSMCPEHGKRMVECFYEHYLPKPQKLSIVLPCRHVVDRPDKEVAVVECVCGSKWELRLDPVWKDEWVARAVRE